MTVIQATEEETDDFEQLLCRNRILLTAITGSTEEGDLLPVRSDSYGFLTAISYDEYAIHQGRAFNLSAFYAVVGVGANADMAIRTGVTVDKNLNVKVSATGAARIRLYEDADVSDGATVPVVALNRRSSNVITLVAVSAPTVNGVGDILYDGLVPSGVVAALGGTSEPMPRWTAKRGTVYLIRVTNLTAVAISVGIEVVTQQQPVVL